MMPNRFLVKRGKVILAELKNCRPGGEMFWIACDCHSRPGFAKVASIFRQIQEIPYTTQEEVDQQFAVLRQQLTDMDITLEDPSTGQQWPHFFLSFFEDDVVEVRY